ncbi:arylsulfatase [Okibacterium endophyticum]
MDFPSLRFSDSEPMRAPLSESSGGRPNVIVVLFDDLGFADFGCFGSQIRTPNIDRLAREGLRYNSFHVTALCSPTRASLLSGRNHHSVEMGMLANIPLQFDGYTSRIPEDAALLPRVMRDAGYATYAVGKWHLAPDDEVSPAGPLDRWPLGAGFERFYGFLGGQTSQWHPDLVRDNSFVEPPRGPEQGYHLTEDLTDAALSYLVDLENSDPTRPFFLYFAPGAVHWPLHVPEEWVAGYRGAFDRGWDELRAENLRRQIDEGIVPPDTALTERPAWIPAWDSLDDDARAKATRLMEVYAGFLTHTDAQLGRLLAHLDATGHAEDTMVLVMSDNGASPDGGPDGRVNIAHDFKVGYEPDDVVYELDDLGGPRSYPQYQWGWTAASNSPFHLWKHFTWLGGVRAPLIARWPGGIAPEQRGQVRDQFLHAIDIRSTILDAASIAEPEAVAGVTQQAIHGETALATFASADTSTRSTQYFEIMGSRALYHDGWIAVTDHVTGTAQSEQDLVTGSQDLDQDRWSLYDLRNDFSQSIDRAGEEPARLRRLVDMWWHEAGRYGVLPLMERPGEIFPYALMRPAPPQGEPVRLRPGGSRIPSPLLATGFRLRVEVKIGSDHADEQWVWQDGPAGGWSLGLAGRRVFWTMATDLTGSEMTAMDVNALPAGAHVIEAELGVDGDAAQLRLHVDGSPVASAIADKKTVSRLLRSRLGQAIRIGEAAKDGVALTRL